MNAPAAPVASHAPIFIDTAPDAAALDPALVGSKAAMLARMAGLGLRVPPAFVLPTTLCGPLNVEAPGAEQALTEGLAQGIRRLEELTGRKFGDTRRPLLVSVRSGGALSMPGMLATVLDVGLNLATVRGLIRVTGNPRMAWDSFRRFAQSYAEVVDGTPCAPFDAAMAGMIRAEEAAGEEDLDPEALERLTRAMLAAAEAHAGRPIPEDPMDQLLAAARGVFRSWDSPRAVEYRRLNHLEALGGTAVTVQAMVFGNSGAGSGVGVAFTRNPATGEKRLYVDFLHDAQGEDVVSGRRTPGDIKRLAERLPDAARELADGAQTLERELADVQDIEFTVESGVLYFLQTRPAKRTPRAVLRTAADLVAEGLITPGQALERVAGVDLAKAGVARFVGEAPAVAVAIGASTGVAAGVAAFDPEATARLVARGLPVILVRQDISTEDIAGLAAADGVLTVMGGRTAHAAVVARQLGKVCVVGCAALSLDGPCAGRLSGSAFKEGDWLSLDGETGEVFLGRRDIVLERPEAEIAQVELWRKQTSAKPQRWKPRP